jgi:hypothetical protein
MMQQYILIMFFLTRLSKKDVSIENLIVTTKTLEKSIINNLV